MTFEIGEANIEYRDEKHYMGIRVQTPFQGMFGVVDKLRKELYAWFKVQGIHPEGPAFLRYHVIDMAGEMDIEFGIQMNRTLPGDSHVTPGVLQAGYYANLTYRGSGMRGNKALIEWAKENGIRWDRWDDAKGDGFRCRYEAYLTNPQIEHRKSKWEVDLAIKITDDHGGLVRRSV
ncbi:GyrI-like domain-containing protein [Paenibacillus soyae]|uniref:GyrI-like domain-containing protein n=1 Tax=Paenibacillus soyae TaxID=2969249 RepID=A0A9X2SC05_9BACL|nr:GyrI-like domain-containing protein [Paenibacillus soyae]MCR2807575.1 GyrI-like domain-containing protein [Paenibacillus soyae]